MAKQKMKKNIYLSLLILVFILAFFLRFYKLGEVPDGLYQDETAIGYNAYSILETAKDEHNTPFPVYFKSFGDHKLPVYVYATAASIKVFGLNAFAVRFPSALFGSLSIVVLFFLLKEVSKSKELPLVTSFLLAINPWHLHFSRAAFEVNLALFFALLGVFTFLRAVRTGKVVFYYVAIAGFVLSLYSYNVARLISPLLFLSLVFLNFKTVKKIKKSTLVSLVLFGLVLCLPFIVSFMSRSGIASAKGALITSADVEAKYMEFRSYVIGYPAIVSKLFFNRYVFMVWTYLSNVVSSLSPAFFFVSGTTQGNQGIGTVGAFYLFEFPLFLTGLFYSIKNKIKNLYFFLIWLVIAFLVLCLSKEVPHATRGYFLMIPMLVLSAYGSLILWKKSTTLLNKKLRNILLAGLLLLAIFNVFYYFSSYYLRFPLFYASNWRQSDEALVNYIQDKDKENEYDKIIIDNSAGFIYTSLLFYSQYDPALFQKNVVRHPDDSEGFSVVKSFGKYEFRSIDWIKDLNTEIKTLLITSEKNKPTDSGILKTFYYPSRPVVVADKETLIGFPFSGVAFVLVESK